jgi:hypothetical protein
MTNADEILEKYIKNNPATKAPLRKKLDDFKPQILKLFASGYTQNNVVEFLKLAGIETDQPALSRWLKRQGTQKTVAEKEVLKVAVAPATQKIVPSVVALAVPAVATPKVEAVPAAEDDDNWVSPIPPKKKIVWGGGENAPKTPEEEIALRNKFLLSGI